MKSLNPRSRPDLSPHLANHRPALDLGWRVALVPASSSLADAIAAAITAQAARGFTIDPATARFIPNYFLPTTAERLPDGETRTRDRGWRNAAATGVVAMQYRLSGPGVHNP